MSESVPASPRTSPAGKIWIIAVFVLGIGAGLFASLYWSRPDHAVAGSFTQIHTALLRGPKEKAARLLAPKIVWDGREVTPEQFLAGYPLPPPSDRIEVVPCAATPGHWVLALRERRYCFVKEGKTWKLHWLQNERCPCQ